MEYTHNMISQRNCLYIVVVLAGLIIMTSVIQAEGHYIEAEDTQPAGEWVVGNEYSGYTGSGYLAYTGSSNRNQDYVLVYEFTITNPGMYWIQIRGRRDKGAYECPADAEDDKCNDIYSKVNNGDWLKTMIKRAAYGGGSDWSSWIWDGSNRVLPGNDPIYDLSAGTNTFYISSRSPGVSLDAIAVFEEGTDRPIPDNDNTPPTVDAGTDQEITLPDNDVELNGTVTDPDDTPTTTWSKQSGAGTVTFGSASSIDTTATFSTSGTYVLELEADDSTNPPVTDTVTITVNPAQSTDQDNDGLPDTWEEEYFEDTGSCDPDADPDSDGLTNEDEYNTGTDPLNPDTDGDGLDDGSDPDPRGLGEDEGTKPGCLTGEGGMLFVFIILLPALVLQSKKIKAHISGLM